MLAICLSLKRLNFSDYSKLLLLHFFSISDMWTQFSISSCILDGYHSLKAKTKS